MKWNQIIGQENAKDYLINAFQQDRVPHALIISGPEGTGQLPLALAFASLLQCESPVDNTACGECNTCKKTFRLMHADINYIFPIANMGDRKSTVDFTKDFKEALVQNPYMSFEDWARFSGIENKRPNINAADIRSIIHTLSMSRFEGRKRIMLIWLPEYLGKEGNILLKLIEEPEDNTHLILVTENREAILSTILSRCQSVKTTLLDDDSIADALQERTGCSAEVARQSAWLSDGHFNLALAKVAGAAEDSSSGFLQWMRICYKAQADEMSAWVDQFNSMSFEGQKHFFQYGLHFLEQCLQAHYMPESHWRLNPEEKKAVKNLLPLLGTEVIGELNELICKDIVYLNRNANAKILMMSTSISMHHLLRGSKKMAV